MKVVVELQIWNLAGFATCTLRGGCDGGGGDGGGDRGGGGGGGSHKITFQLSVCQ